MAICTLCHICKRFLMSIGLRLTVNFKKRLRHPEFKPQGPKGHGGQLERCSDKSGAGRSCSVRPTMEHLLHQLTLSTPWWQALRVGAHATRWAT